MAGDVTIGLAFLAGLISFISPCVLPLVPAYIGYMGGRMTKQVTATDDTPGKTFREHFGTLMHGWFFVAGFTVFFVVFGLITTAAVSSLTEFGVTEAEVREGITRVGGTAVILFGLHVMGLMNRIIMWLMKQAAKLDQSPYGNLISALIGIVLLGVVYWLFVESWLMVLLAVLLFTQVFRDSLKTDTPGQFWIAILTKVQTALYVDTRRQGQPQNQRYGYFGSMFMGVVFSAGWTPCIGPIYGSILITASSGQSVSEAATLLTAYSLGLGIPFLLTALALDQAQGVFRRLQRNMRTIEAFSGGFLLLLGVLIFTGQMERLTQIGGEQGELGDLSLNLENCIVGAVEGKVRWGNVVGCIGDGTKDTFYVAVSKDDPNAAADTVAVVENTPASDGEAIPPGPDAGLNVPSLGENNASENAALAVPDLGASGPEQAEPDGAMSAGGTSESVPVNAPEGFRVGQRAPDFTTQLLDGNTISLSDFQGKIVFLNFWATWCTPCKEEMPALQTIYESYQDDGFVVLAINNTSTEFDQGRIAPYVADFGLTFPVGLDESGAIAEEQYKGAIPGLPTSFLIDQDGVIQAYFPTSIDGSDLIAALDELLDT
jgi:cytochrome c-type biogenesis protein